MSRTSNSWPSSQGFWFHKKNIHIQSINRISITHTLFLNSHPSLSFSHTHTHIHLIRNWRKEMYFLLGWMCICLWNFNTLLYSIVPFRFYRINCCRNAKYDLEMKVKKEKNTALHASYKMNVEFRPHRGRNRHKKEVIKKTYEISCKFHSNSIDG